MLVIWVCRTLAGSDVFCVWELLMLVASHREVFLCRTTAETFG